MDGSAGPPGPSTPSAEEWQAHWAHTVPQLQALSRRLGSAGGGVSIMRSSQLDAARLDDELTSMLREQFIRVFALFQPGVIASLQAELTLLLDLLVFWFSIRQGKPLPGMALMNLRHRNERAVQAVQPVQAAQPPATACSSSGPAADQPLQLTPLTAAAAAAAAADYVGGGRSGVEGPGLSPLQRGLYCFGSVVLKYGWGKLLHLAAVWHWGDAAAGSWRRAGWGALRRAESGYRLAALLNFLVFLQSGKYRSLLERLLSARLVYAQPSAARAISFEYLNRQLVWAELSELLLFLLPLVDVGAIRRALRAHLPRLPALGGALGAAGLAGGGKGGGEGSGEAGAPAPEAPCPICSVPLILSPWEARPCGHRFCYFCLRSHCLADVGYTCPTCLARVEVMQRCVARLPEAGGHVAAEGEGAARRGRAAG